MALLPASCLTFVAVIPAEVFEGSQPSVGTVVKGDVLYWEGEELIVKEMSGREARLLVTAETKVEGAVGRLKTDDKIAAQIDGDGRARSIMVQLPDSGTNDIPPGSR
ncbi:MAG: hypothetical protein OJF47_003595 [Nitrospira sp.]|jgi:hypothetical protein|nr:MAG: hypothetical protein OJF47_003595 [Nitrospira sp.]